MLTDWKHLQKYGYAPGGYMVKCVHCGTVQIDMDKRAATCLLCATELYEVESKVLQAQEPVAFVVGNRVPDECNDHISVKLPAGTNLYAAPQLPEPCPETESAVRYLKAAQQMDAAEIDRLFRGLLVYTDAFETECKTTDEQSALIKELEETRDALWETQRALCNQVYERDMLIERCRDALSMPCDHWNKRQSLIVNDVLEAIAAIVAHKKGIAE